MTDQNQEPGSHSYPPKPEEEVSRHSVVKSLLSVLVFIAAFYLIFNWSLIFILGLVVVIFIHEMGHYLAMRHYDYKDLSIFFIPLLGAMASGEKDKISQKQSVVVLLAGPLPGIIIGCVLYLWLGGGEKEWVRQLAGMFVFINLFNLIPIIPLDGGRMLSVMFLENKRSLNRIFIYISMALATAFALFTQSYIFLIIPFLLLLQLRREKELKTIREDAREKGIDLEQSYGELSDRDYWQIRDSIARHNKFFGQLIKEGEYEVSQSEGRVINVVKSIIHRPPEKDLSPAGKVLIVLVWLAAFLSPLLFVLQ